MPDEGAVVQVDCAPGLQTLAAESKMDGSILRKLGIVVDIGRTLNKNKNPIAENCIKEFHKERLRLNIPAGKLSNIDRAIITKNMNSRIRNRGYTAKEMAFNRDQINNCLKPVSDEHLSSEQVQKRQIKHNKPTEKNDENAAIKIGDDVYVKEDKSKQRARETYKVVKLFKKGDEKWAILQKNSSKFMAKEYEVKIAEIFPVSKKKLYTYSYKDVELSDDRKNESGVHEHKKSDDKDENKNNSNEDAVKESIIEDGKDEGNNSQKDPPRYSLRPRSQRKAAFAAREAFKHYKIKAVNSEDYKSNPKLKVKSSNPPDHVWNHSDWIKLNEEYDENVNPKGIQKSLPISGQSSESIPALIPPTKQCPKPCRRVSNISLPSTPDLDFIRVFNNEQFNANAQTSSGLVQMFPPVDEPEPEWDHSPEFLTADAHNTWDETIDIDEKVSKVTQPRQLFIASESITESLTSLSSEDSLFLYEPDKIKSKIFKRSDVKRKQLKENEEFLVTNLKRDNPENEDGNRATDDDDAEFTATDFNVQRNDSRTGEVVNDRDDAENFGVINVSNLVEWEIEAENEENESEHSNTEGGTDPSVSVNNEEDILMLDKASPETVEPTLPMSNQRPIRSSRKEMNYKHFNTYGYEHGR